MSLIVSVADRDGDSVMDGSFEAVCVAVVSTVSDPSVLLTEYEAVGLRVGVNCDSEWLLVNVRLGVKDSVDVIVSDWVRVRVIVGSEERVVVSDKERVIVSSDVGVCDEDLEGLSVPVPDLVAVSSELNV